MSEETLYREALAKPASERAAFLEAACAGQPQLLRGVEVLLVKHEASGSRLDGPPAELVEARSPRAGCRLSKFLCRNKAPVLTASVVLLVLAGGIIGTTESGAVGKRPDAEQWYRQTLELLEKLAARFPTVPEYRHDLALSHNSLGDLLYDLGKQAEAEKQYRHAVDSLEKLAVGFPTDPAYRHDLADSHYKLGLVLAEMGKRPGAEQQYRHALGIRQKLAADFPTVPKYRQELACSQHKLGALLNDLGKQAEAEQQYRRHSASGRS